MEAVDVWAVGGERRFAERVDRRTGVRELAGFFGDSGARWFGVLHLPATPPRAGVVVCSPIGAELLKNYRREVLLARALADAGVAVLRPHYRGTGNSEGDPLEVTVTSMVADIAAAAGELSLHGIDGIGLVGTRLGAVVAVMAAGRLPGDGPLALWDPVVDGTRYFREVFRAPLVRDLARGHKRDRGDFAEDLQTSGSVGILGYTIGRRLHEEASTVVLHDLTTGGRPILVLQTGRGETVRSDLQKVIARWGEDGSAVDVRAVTPEESWWFVSERFEIEEDRTQSAALVVETASWLGEKLVVGNPR